MSAARVCIIGAGSSGIVAAKVLHERGIPFDCYEKGSGIGGNWRYMNDNEMSSSYWSLHINTSRDKMAYSDFPMPETYPDFPHHTQILDYFEDYVDHFGFRDAITFCTEVEHVAPVGDGTYDVRLRNVDTDTVETKRYGAVIVANGHHWCPNWPDFPGTFDGEVMHSHYYKTPDVLDGKRVLVVGAGNSACDIACEAARHAEATFQSTRRGAHVVPKYLLGRPLDEWVTPLSAKLPFWLQRTMMKVLLWLSRGNQDNYGFPTPEHDFGAEHPTISSDLLNLVGHGKITVKPNIERLYGDGVRFEDGTTEAIDLIIYATGYRIRFPFFDDDFIGVEDNDLPLYQHVVPPEIPNLYFLGLLQPLGAIMPLAEVQAEWIADLLEGKAGLPDRAAMWRQIRAYRAKIRKRYVESKRHTIQVDFYPYKNSIERERVRGRSRSPAQALPQCPEAVPA